MSNYCVKGTLQLLVNGSSTLEQTVEIINMYIKVSESKGYSEGVLDGLKTAHKSRKSEQEIRDMGM